MEINLENSKMLHLMRAKGLELFYKKGYYNTSLTDILKDLSTTEAVFKYHFQSKEDFFISIAQNLILQRTLDLLIEPVSYKQNPFSLILDMFENEMDKVTKSTTDYGFMLSNFMNEFNNRNPRINKYLLDILKIWEINLGTLLRKGQLDGYVNHHIDCESAANHVISSYFGIRTLMVEGNTRTLSQQFLQQLRYYFHSISQKITA
ncbi:TetR/AcrR family transcriptional regulator [Croceitalea rosinachiae]|uniref:Helix-turn-helix domain-containing protein n=1 Tax=Croceitalea rosinachiae TaxID=3075596 RepID=A0ABU3A7U2_9FLAO|nr:helix-turn-helix domain-containing protein [Croceitalea sp. F388]MDT0606231.1 helix-turn-helix domain-containing protein [Croceitalea sp. F388]